MGKKNVSPKPKPNRKEATTYHNAVFAALEYILRKHLKNGDVTIVDEHKLSKQPLKIDFMVIKKNRNVEIKNCWGKIFRKHNIIEYKSPSDTSPSLSVFYKVNGYACIYASQTNIKFTDMSLTIICSRKPVKLFGRLQNELDYEVLQKDTGVYYIIQRGVAIEKNLAMQIVVNSELPDDDDVLLQALRPGIDRATAERIASFPVEDEEYAVSLSQWWKVILSLNKETLLLEADMNLKKKEKELIEFWANNGRLTEYEQEWKLKGMQKVFALLEKGYSPTEAKKKLQLV